MSLWSSTFSNNCDHRRSKNFWFKGKAQTAELCTIFSLRPINNCSVNLDASSPGYYWLTGRAPELWRYSSRIIRVLIYAGVWTAGHSPLMVSNSILQFLWKTQQNGHTQHAFWLLYCKLESFRINNLPVHYLELCSHFTTWLKIFITHKRMKLNTG